MSSKAISIGATLLSLKAIVDLMKRGQLTSKSAFSKTVGPNPRPVYDIRSNNSLDHDRVLNWHQKYSRELAGLTGIQIGVAHSAKVLYAIGAEVEPQIQWFSTGPTRSLVVSNCVVEGFVVPTGATIYESKVTGFKSSVIIQIRLVSAETIWIMVHPILGLSGVELADLLCRMVSAEKTPLQSCSVAVPTVRLETDANIDWLRGIEVGGNPLPHVSQKVHLSMLPKDPLDSASLQLDPNGVFEVNSPFYLAVSRTETSFPYVGGFIDLDSMKPIRSS
jgi:hypothetical protein